MEIYKIGPNYEIYKLLPLINYSYQCEDLPRVQKLYKSIDDPNG